MSDSPTFLAVWLSAMVARCLQDIPAGHPRALLAFNGREELQQAGQREIDVGNAQRTPHRFATVAA